eukprot:30708-Pelagococcus_subviridis.AAC.2
MHAIIISHIHISYGTSRATYACALPSRRHARRGRRLAVAAPPRAARGLFATSSSPPSSSSSSSSSPPPPSIARLPPSMLSFLRGFGSAGAFTPTRIALATAPHATPHAKKHPMNRSQDENTSVNPPCSDPHWVELKGVRSGVERRHRGGD